ncbi:MAG: ABC transporter permease subunit [Clostridia bacterium]|nr:ABC transporter permease subunit [Clostridia bacterium]
MQSKAKKRRTQALWLLLPLGAITALFVAAPLVYVIALSFLQRGESMGVTGPATVESYVRMFDARYARVMLDSISIAVYTTVLSLLIGYPFAYFMARAKRRWRNLLMLLVIVPFWTNALVRVYGWRILLLANGPINTFLLQIGLIDRPLKLLFTYGAMLLGMVYSLLPFMILPVYSSVEKMDWQCEAAARDLGAGPWRAFFTVTLPLTMPGVLAGCVLVFVPSVGLFFIADLLGGSQVMVIGNLIRDQLLKARDWPFGSALSVALLAVTCAVLFIYRRAGGKDLGVF